MHCFHAQFPLRTGYVAAATMILAGAVPAFGKRESRVDVVSLLKDSSHSTVRIEGVNKRGRYTFRSHGAGVVISGDGYIVTALHVVEGFARIIIKTRDGQTLAAKAVRFNSKLDLALLKCNPIRELVSAYFRPPAQSEAGDDVIAIGNPRGRGQVAKAGVLGDTRTVQWSNTEANLRAVAAPIRPGYSGGGSYDMETGELVGIQVAQSLTRPDIGYIVPEEVVRDWVASSKALDPHDVDLCDLCRTRLGCWLRPVTLKHAKYRGGLMATKIELDGPADRCGWREGDLVVALDTYKVTLLDDVQYVLAACRGSRKLRFRLLRDETLHHGELPIAPVSSQTTDVAAVSPAPSVKIDIAPIGMLRQAASLLAVGYGGFETMLRKRRPVAVAKVLDRPIDLARVAAARKETQPDVMESADPPFRTRLPTPAEIAAAREAARKTAVAALPVAAN